MQLVHCLVSAHLQAAATKNRRQTNSSFLHSLACLTHCVPSPAHPLISSLPLARHSPFSPLSLPLLSHSLTSCPLLQPETAASSSGGSPAHLTLGVDVCPQSMLSYSKVKRVASSSPSPSSSSMQSRDSDSHSSSHLSQGLANGQMLHQTRKSPLLLLILSVICISSYAAAAAEGKHVTACITASLATALLT